MSLRRRRGQTARIWKSRTITDRRRGNDVVMADADGPHEVRAVSLPKRSSKAEVPGQQQINVMRMLVDPGLADVNLWSRVKWAGCRCRTRPARGVCARGRDRRRGSGRLNPVAWGCC